MKDWKVTVRPMSKSVDNGRVKEKTFYTEQDAYEYFSKWCDEHGYEYDSLSIEAGGLGHDYRIEITF